MILNNFKTFTFNGKNSYDDLGIIVTNMPPVPLPKRDITTTQIQGSNRVLHVDNGAYEYFDYTIDCILKDLTKVDTLKTLFKSFGEIELSILPGRKYKCCNVNQIDFENFVNAGLEFPLELEMDPIAIGELKTQEISSSQTITVGGTENAYPIITVTGTGTITINNVAFEVLESGITLDCEDQEAYNGNISKNDKIVLDEFPTLIPGENTITLDPNVTIELQYNERWL